MKPQASLALKVFNSENLPKGGGSGRTGLPTISIGKKGVFNITAKASALMGFKADDTISFAHDEVDPTVWYVYKDKEGFQFRLHSDKASLVMSHQELGNQIRDGLGITDPITIKLRIAGQPTVIEKVKYWGLIYIPKS